MCAVASVCACTFNTLLCSKAPHVVLSYINKAYGGKYQDKKSSNLSKKLDQKYRFFLWSYQIVLGQGKVIFPH